MPTKSRIRAASLMFSGRTSGSRGKSCSGRSISKTLHRAFHFTESSPDGCIPFLRAVVSVCMPPMNQSLGSDGQFGAAYG